MSPGGTLLVDHATALGATNGETVVASGSTLEVGVLAGSPVSVSGETVSIAGAGVGGSLGALRGAATASGTNVWDGPVTLAADGTRIGTEDGGTLRVSGSISDKGSGYGVILRPGASGVLVLSGASNRWSGVSQMFGGGSGRLVLGLDNVLPTASTLTVGEGVVDLNGHSQTVAGLGLNGGTAGNASVINDGTTTAVLTLNPMANLTFPGNVQNGVGTLAVVKEGTNTQTLSGYNTYTGPTRINGGKLGVTLPMSSSALTVADGTGLAVGVAGSSWTLASAAFTNATLDLNYGTLFGVPPAVLAVTALSVSGSNVVNLTVTNLPVGQTPLITYTSKQGGGSFHLGPLPVGVAATIVDTGSAIVLDVTVSAQTLTWFGSTSGTWNTNGTLDWNYGVSAYQEYGPAGNRVGDFVLFDDTAAVYAVNATTDLRPYSVTVNNPANAYTIGGTGKIGGLASLTKAGAGALALTSVNDYTGGTAVRGGMLEFAPGSLGTTGNVVVANGGTLRWADGNAEDLSARLRIDGVAGAVATLDFGTNDLSFASGINQSSTGGLISNAVTKLGAGKLTLASGATAIGQVVRLNAGAVEVAAGASLTTDGNGAYASAALVVDQSSFTVAGGTVTVGDRFGVASSGASTGVVTIASGSITVDTGSAETTRGLRLAGAGGLAVGNNDNQATVNLDGGTLTVSRIFPGTGANNTSLVNFNGGTLKPGGGVMGDDFMTNLTHAYVKSGGAVVDTAGSDITIGQALENDGVASPDGGLQKLGAGKLTLAGANTYTGPTVVSNGTLHVSGTLGPSAVAVKAGGTLAFGTDAALGESLNLSSTLQLAGKVLIRIGAAPACDSISGVTDITYGGTLTVTNATGATLAPGDVFTLFSAAGTKTGNFVSIEVLPVSLGLSGTFNPATGQLTLAAGAPPTLSYVNTGSGLQFSWTGNFKLQAQTNSLSVGLSNNWQDYPGGSSSPVTVPLDAAQGSVFFRLATP
jgi:fibronectin-binding autotransporter adhesin